LLLPAVVLCGCLGPDHLLGGLSDGSGDGSGDTGSGGATTDESGADTGEPSDPFDGAEAIKTWADGITGASSGVWSPTRSRVLVTDPVEDAILEVRPMSFEAVVTPAGTPLAIVEDGDATIVGESAGRLVRRDADGATVLVDGLAEPRALAIAASGDVWAVLVDGDAGAIGRLASDGAFATVLEGQGALRGLALAPTEDALYTVRGGELLRIAIDDGAVGSPEPLAPIAEPTTAVCVDDRGDVLVGSGTALVAVGADGDVLGMLEVGEVVVDCTFGGYDRHTLLLSTANAVLTVRMPVAGPP
jgi:sugar lactone lactonase YvrE